jgi:DNA-binding LacI/PurR family transcriptional regulator
VAARPAGVPLVLLGERYGDGDDHVGVDSVAAATTATSHLLEDRAAAGRRDRPAAAPGQPDRAAARDRVPGGARAGRAPRGPAARGAGRAPAPADGARAMRTLLALDEPPDAVFCFTDELALGALRVAWERGVRVPDDLALVGFDDVEDGRWSRPSLSTVSPDKAVLAEVAVDRLLERVAGGGGPPRSTTTPHALVVRESSAPEPPSADPLLRQGRAPLLRDAAARPA